jgi:hypothetical protein
VHEALKKKDTISLSSRQKKLTTQMFVLDVEKFRSFLSTVDYDLDSADTVFMHWKGDIINYSQIDHRINAFFHVAHAGHLFFNVKDSVNDSVSLDTVVKPYYGNMSWFRSVGFSKYEFGISIEFENYDSLADCEIRTDYFGLTFRFNDSVTTSSSTDKIRHFNLNDNFSFKQSSREGCIEFHTGGFYSPRITIYSLAGKLIYQTTSDLQPPGKRSIFWNGCSTMVYKVMPGVYTVVIEQGRNNILRNTILMR